MYNLQLGSIYDFTMRAPGILGLTFRNAKVMALLDYDSANTLEDVTPIHESVRSELPVGTPRSAKDLIYVKIKTSTGAVRVVAMDWIASVPQLVEQTTAHLTIQGITMGDLPNLRKTLIMAGFKNFDIRTETTA